MAYTPQNPPVYLTALAAAVGAMGAGGRAPGGDVTALAGAFAQAVDTAWTGTAGGPPDGWQLTALGAATAAVWQAQGLPAAPSASAAGTYTPLATRIVAAVQQAKRYAVAALTSTNTLPAFTATDVYIDAQNGNDGNSGLTAATPWQHNYRLQAAVGVYGLIANSVTVHYVGTASPPASDPFTLLAILGPDTVLTRDFSGVTGQTVYTGSFSAVRTINHATNTAPGLTDSAIPSWAPYVGMRLRITSGAALGATAIVLRGETATRAETSVPTRLNGLNETVIYPTPGDSYVIEALPSDWQGAIDLKVQGNDNFSAVLLHSGAMVEANSSISTLNMGLVFFRQCVFRQQELISMPTNREYAACGFQQGFVHSGAGPTVLMKACGVIGVCAVVNSAILTIHTTADTIVDGGGVVAIDGGRILIGGSCGSFNATANIYNLNGDGICGSKDNYASEGEIDQIGTGGAVYGQGNAGVGWRVGHGSTDTTDVRPTVTGTGGDFALVSGANVYAFDPVAATYSSKAATWANFNAAAQLNGQAHNPMVNAHLVGPAGS